MPRSRKISMVRWLVMCERGVFAVHRYFVIMTLSTPRVDKNKAADDPAGPEPTIRTSVCTTTLSDPVVSGRAVSTNPSSNAGIGSASPPARRPLCPGAGRSVLHPARRAEAVASKTAEIRLLWRKLAVDRHVDPGPATQVCGSHPVALLEPPGKLRGRAEPTPAGDFRDRHPDLGRVPQHAVRESEAPVLDVARNARTLFGKDAGQLSVAHPD